MSLDVCEHGGLRRKCDICDLRDEVNLLRVALMNAQGDAYLGTMMGSGVPDPVTCCRSIIKTCQHALNGWDQPAEAEVDSTKYARKSEISDDPCDGLKLDGWGQ